MHYVLLKLTVLGKFFETSNPETDQVLPTVRKVETALDRVSRLDVIHQTARNFCVVVLSFMDRNSRFRNFSDIIYAATLLNPNRSDRNKLSSTEYEKGNSYLLSLADTIAGSEISVVSPEMNDLDAVFSDKLTVTQHFGIDSFKTELTAYLTQTDERCTDFEFFRQPSTQWPFLRKFSGSLLSILPSPAVAERFFSRAGYLSIDRRNKILPENL